MSNFESIKALFPTNESVAFIANRFEEDNYRGMPLSNHNRQMHFEYLWIVLKTIYKYSKNNPFLIRHTDISKNPINTQWPVFEKIVNEIFAASDKGKGGDSLRKQIFVDMSRIGFLERIDKKGRTEKLATGFAQSKFSTYMVKIPDWVCSYIVENKKRQLNHVYLDRINTLTNDILSNLIKTDDSVFEKMTIFEVAFFLTAYTSNFNGYLIDLSYISYLIKQWRSLRFVQQNEVVRELKKKCNEINKNEKAKERPNKKNLRDFGNFINHARQLMFILTQTPYYSYGDPLEKSIIWMNVVETETKITGKRDLHEKEKYYSYHNVLKHLYKSYEMHHIIPLHTAIDPNDRKILDNHLNMVLIDGNTHNNIHHTTDGENNKFCFYKLVKDESNNHKFKLYDTSIISKKGDKNFYIEITNDVNAKFDPNRLDEMLKYNNQFWN